MHYSWRFYALSNVLRFSRGGWWRGLGPARIGTPPIRGLQALVRLPRLPLRFTLTDSEVLVQERGRRIRNATDFVGGLTIELEVEFRRGPTVFPVRVMLQFIPA